MTPKRLSRKRFREVTTASFTPEAEGGAHVHTEESLFHMFESGDHEGKPCLLYYSLKKMALDMLTH